MAADCGKERCCLGGKFCSPYLFKYAPCNLKVSYDKDIGCNNDVDHNYDRNGFDYGGN